MTCMKSLGEFNGEGVIKCPFEYFEKKAAENRSESVLNTLMLCRPKLLVTTKPFAPLALVTNTFLVKTYHPYFYKLNS